MRTPERPLRFVVALAVALGGGVAVVRAASDPPIDGPATARSVAVRIEEATQPGDAVSVFEVGELGAALSGLVADAARLSSASWAPVRSATVGMIAIRRGGADVKRAPGGYRYPMVVTALDPVAADAVMSRSVGGAVRAADGVALGATAARLWGAAAGDLVDVVAGNGSVRSLRVEVVVPDREVGGAEAVMSTATADRLGLVRASRAVIWGFRTRSALDQAIMATGLDRRRETRAVRSWDPPNPDSTLSTVRTKDLLGEFAYRVNSDGSVTQEAAWANANLPATREVLDPVIRIRARCHLRVVPDLRAALAAVAAAGLASTIDVNNANLYGGCHYPRFNRISAEFGFLSRHSWAMALDTNTVANCQGCVPRMDCRVVHIFRRHGFAWGGNFLRPDGMHFEWVGERRDQVPYPSTYCPNPAVGLFSTDGGSGIATFGDSRGSLFADETMATDHEHLHDHEHLQGTAVDPGHEHP